MADLNEAQTNGDSPSQGNDPGVAPPPQQGAEKSLLPIDPRGEGEKANHQLLDEIKQKILAINPLIFKGVIEELADLIDDFKQNMPTYEMLQFTMPDAYNNLLSIMGTLSTLAQLMMQNGDLPTDQSVVSVAANDAIMQNVDQAGGGSGSPKDDEGLKKKRQTYPVGTIMNNGANGKPRIKTADGWRYVSAGLGASVGRQKNKI